VTAAPTGRADLAGALEPSDLAELITSFNDVTSKLEATHAQLRSEVHRLNGELREANERLRRSERLAELGEMAAGIAHEIRNPLGSIGLYSEVLAGDLERLPGADSSEDGPCATARKIGSAVRRLDSIVRDVLDFARDLRVRPEPVGPGELFDAAAGSPRLGGEPGGGDGAPIRRLDLLSGHPGVVWCDRSLALQALLNVIENARQASGGNGPVTLDCRRASVRSSDGKVRPGVALIVRDEGPGIDPSVLERMFNPFFTTRNTGTGLGLAIVHRIVDAHGGGVVVRNNRDLDGSDDPGARGATVELRFPDAEGDG
jgi:two-component system sensor histidine kinase HydH